MSRDSTLLWLLVSLVVVGTALFLRLDGLGEPSLWYDEVLHLNLARKALEEPLSSWMTGRIGDRENGPLYYATQLMAQRVASGEVAFRLVPAIMGTATVVVMAGLGLATSGSRLVALVAASLLATSPLHVYFSREGRPYSAIMLMAGIFLLLLLQRDRSWAVPVAYLSSIATASFGAIAFPVLISFGTLSLLDWAIWQRVRTSLALHFAAAALVGSSLLILPTIERFEAAKPYSEMFVTHPLSATAADRLLASFTVSGVDWATSRPLSFVLVALSCCGGLFLASRDRRRALHIAGMFLLPIVCWLTLLVSFDHWYVVRYTSAGLPAFLLLVAVGIVSLIEGISHWIASDTDWARFSWVSSLVALSMTAFLGISNWRAVRTEPWQKPDWRGLADLINLLRVDNEPVIAQSRMPATCIRYYFNQAGHQIEVLNAGKEVERAVQIGEEHQGAWVLSSGYSRAADFRAWMSTLDPVLRSRLSNLALYYYPNFSAFLDAPERAAALAQILESENRLGDRRDFAASELLLGTGWSYPETSGDGTEFRWAAAEATEMGLLAKTPPDSSLRLRLFPFPAPNQPSQIVEVHLNDQLVGRLQLRPGWNDYIVPIPEEQWHVGANLVTFHFGWLRSPVDLDSNATDSRSLAVAFDLVESTSNSPDPNSKNHTRGLDRRTDPPAN